MDERSDPTPNRLLDYHKAEAPSVGSMALLASRIGWVSLGFSVLLFIDPYLPELHVLMLLPIGGAAAGVVLAALALHKSDHRRAAWMAMVPNLLALIVPGLSMLTRFLAPVRWR